MTDETLLSIANRIYERDIDSYFHFDESESQAIVRFAIQVANKYHSEKKAGHVVLIRDACASLEMIAKD